MKKFFLLILVMSSMAFFACAGYKEEKTPPGTVPPPPSKSEAPDSRVDESRSENILTPSPQPSASINQVDKSSYSTDLTATGGRMPPVIAIASPKDGLITSMEKVKLTGVVKDDHKVVRVDIEINGQKLKTTGLRGLGGLAGTNRKKSMTQSWDISMIIPLKEGKNTISVTAYDSENLFSTSTLTVTREAEQSEIWAVVIGIGNYQKVRPLKYAVNDAKAMYDYLIEDLGVPSDHITLLLDEEADLASVKKELGTELRRKAKRNDQVIIFFAGHGAPEPNENSPDGDGVEKYFLTYGVEPDDLYSTALPMEEVSRIFNRIKAERLVFLADTCFSGNTGGKTFRSGLTDTFWERISKGKGRVIISASSANEVSQEWDEFKHGVFTYYLLEGLRGKADLDGDGLIDTEEVYRYVSKKVPAATGQQQNPIRKGEVEGQIIIGKAKKPTK